MDVLQAAALGLIQGLGEFLPVSSSGHLLLARLLFGLNDQASSFKVFDILLHVGTLIPLVFVFWKDWMEMLRHPIRNKTLLHLFIASVPTLLIYLAAGMIIKVNDDIKGFAIFDSGWFLGASFLITALFLLICDAVSARRSVSGKEVGIFQAVVMGIFQGIGMIPGVSRSGSTILGDVVSGLDRKKAASFSFMMSAPAILGSLIMEGKDALEAGDFASFEFVPIAVGIAVAALSGIFALRFMLKIIARVPLCRFAVYLAVLGIIILLFQLAGSSILPVFAPPAAV